MNKIDFQAINATLNAETLVPQWLPDGKRSGSEWVARNPNRADKTPGSFTINLRTGKWADFASGDSGGDLVSLYAYLFHANDNGKAAKELADQQGVRLGDPEVREAAASNLTRLSDKSPTPVLPAPADVAEPKFTHGKFGAPTTVFTYRDTDARVLMHVARFDPAGMRKQILPMTWCRHPDGSERWTWRGITGQAKRPLYGLDRLAANPDADVIVVEGEKAADAGQQLMGNAAVVVTWLGGVETSDRVSLRALAGRRVILLPDQDAQDGKELHEQPGMRAMLNIATGARGIAREVLMVRYTPGERESGWDLADALAEGWTGEDVLKMIGQNAGDPWHVAAPAADEAPVPANDNREPLPQLVPMAATVNPFGFPHLTDRGQPMNTVENLEYMLGQYGIECRYNQVRKQVEVTIPGRDYGADNRANCSLAELGSICARNRMPKGDLADYVKLLADRNTFNPVADWITSKPWDGQSRLDDLFATVQADMDERAKNILIYRWMLSAVAAIFKPHGFVSHGVLVFTGRQGQGKTSWVKSLAPSEMGVVLDGAIVDPANKDTVINAVSHWLVELGELDATFRKADIARLKSFITQPVDKLRRPYDRIESEYQRRTVFFASVNESRYLIDDTGNRRWWTVPVTALDYSHGIDVQQLWAEVLVHFQRGEQWWLTSDELDTLNTVNEEHQAIDPVEERILAAFDWDAPNAGQEMTATDVLLAVGYDKPNRAAATHASAVLQKLTGGKPRRAKHGRFFRMPPRMNGGGYGDRPF